MTMLDVLNANIPDDVSIKSVKETNTKFTIVFEFEGDTAKAELPKSCAPGCQDEVANNTIKTAMSTIYFNRGDFITAKAWLDGSIKSSAERS